MSPSRRLLFACLALIAVVVAGFTVLGQVTRSQRQGRAVDQGTAGPVLLVPGYGGSTGSLEVLAARLREDGRTATVVHLPGDGTGDLRADVAVLSGLAHEAVAAGAPSVDVVGYSAGGVVARLWAGGDGRGEARRVVTLGSPFHGTSVAGLAQIFAAGACPLACQQLVPGSDLLDGLGVAPPGARWLSVWTTQDTTVTPPESARLGAAANLPLQQLCPGLRVSHSELPRNPQIEGVVLAALSGPQLVVPPSCPAP